MAPEAFARFGEVMQMTDQHRPPDFEGVGTHAWIPDYEEGGQTQLMAINSWYQGLHFTRLERHFDVTQTFVALGPSASAVAVAAPTDPNDPDAIPSPDDVRAFLIDKPMGYILKRGTWHSLDRYPLYPPEANFVIVTTKETTDELKNVEQANWRLTQDVDYAERFDASFEIVL
jgi:ureidoglycolate lyase